MSKVLLEARQVCKHFGGVKALTDVSLTIRAASIEYDLVIQRHLTSEPDTRGATQRDVATDGHSATHAAQQGTIGHPPEREPRRAGPRRK